MQPDMGMPYGAENFFEQAAAVSGGAAGSAAGGKYYADANTATLLLDGVARGAEMGSHLSGFGNAAGVSVNLLRMLELDCLLARLRRKAKPVV